MEYWTLVFLRLLVFNLMDFFKLSILQAYFKQGNNFLWNLSRGKRNYRLGSTIHTAPRLSVWPECCRTPALSAPNFYWLTTRFLLIAKSGWLKFLHTCATWCHEIFFVKFRLKFLSTKKQLKSLEQNNNIKIRKEYGN